jgi:hypothetical protein
MSLFSPRTVLQLQEERERLSAAIHAIDVLLDGASPVATALARTARRMTQKSTGGGDFSRHRRQEERAAGDAASGP